MELLAHGVSGNAFHLASWVAVAWQKWDHSLIKHDASKGCWLCVHGEIRLLSFWSLGAVSWSLLLFRFLPYFFFNFKNVFDFSHIRMGSILRITAVIL